MIIACSKPEPVEPGYNAEVISYDGRKCYCLYGWMIVMGNDTILSTSDYLRQKVGYDIVEPVKVNIQIVEQDDFCKYKYCEVIEKTYISDNY